MRNVSNSSDAAPRARRAKVETPADGEQSMIHTFADMKPLVRQLIKRVHPDAVHAHPEAVRSQNHSSLLAFDAMLAAVGERCALCSKPSKEPGQLSQINQVYKLKFHWEDRETAKLSCLTYDAVMPLDLDAQTRLVITRSVNSPTLHAEWLKVALTHVKHLLHGVRVRCNAAVPSARPAKKRLFQQDTAPIDSSALLRANLVEWSPIQQGKINAFPKPRPFVPASSSATSLFSRTQRHDRVAALFHRKRISADPSLAPQVAAHALANFSQHLMAHFDRWLLFHNAWYSVRVVLGHTYMCVPAARALYIPARFIEADLVAFMDEHLPSILREATEGAIDAASKLPKQARRDFHETKRQ